MKLLFNPAHLSRRDFLGRASSSLAIALATARSGSAAAAIDTDYQFNGPIPQNVLHNYLSRTLSMRGLWAWKQWTGGDPLTQYNDNLRMIGNLRVKHVTFVGDLWWDLNTAPYEIEKVIEWTAGIVADLHAIDADIIVGAACFETIGPAADAIPIPVWVFDEMGVPRETRNFQWDRMTYADSRPSDGNPSTPALDITRLEARLWYYYWARRYIDSGCEHLDMGEIITIAQNDRPNFSACFDLVGRIRAYARIEARRKWILISGQTEPLDANGNTSWTGTFGIADDAGHLLLDYVYGTTRAKENASSPQDCILARFAATIFGRTRGGISPSGWRCERTPYTVNLDPGPNPKPGTPVGWPFQWGWCEPAWFASQPASYRADWLRYTNAWIAMVDPYGFFAFTGQVFLNGGIEGVDWYHANPPWYEGPSSGQQWFKGFDEERVIAEIWSGTANPTLLNGDFSRPVLEGSRLDFIAPEIPSWTFGTPVLVYDEPSGAPLPSGQSATSMSGVARAGSVYVGSATLGPSQQAAFLLGTGSISQALVFPGDRSYTLRFNCAVRAASEQQEILVWLDNTLLLRCTPAASWSSYEVDLQAPDAGVHVIKISGSSSGTDTGLLEDMRLLPYRRWRLPMWLPHPWPTPWRRRS